MQSRIPLSGENTFKQKYGNSIEERLHTGFLHAYETVNLLNIMVEMWIGIEPFVVMDT